MAMKISKSVRQWGGSYRSAMLCELTNTPIMVKCVKI